MCSEEYYKTIRQKNASNIFLKYQGKTLTLAMTRAIYNSFFNHKAKIIQKRYRYHHFRRCKAIIKIQRCCHNWVWKPLCKDGTVGIRPRLDMKILGLDNCKNTTV